jgi:hypothetical protein
MKMNNLKSISSSSQSAAKLILESNATWQPTGAKGGIRLSLLGLLAGFVLSIGIPSRAVDPFAPPQKEAAPPSFPTIATLLAATRTSEIPLALTSEEPKTQHRYQAGVGNSVVTLLLNQNIIRKDAVRFNTADLIGLMFINLAMVELSDRKNEGAAETFQSNWKQFCDQNHTKDNPRLRDELESILKQYSQAVRESVILKKGADDRRIAEQAEKQRQSNLGVQRMSEDAAQRKAVADAQAASKRAEDQAREAAVGQAMQAQADVRRKKLEEVLASPAYKRWEVAIQVEEGLRLIQTGQRDLAKEDNVEHASGVTDLKARRAAGERIAGGKLLVERSFDLYQKLGGEATTPEQVKAGPDPAAEYR